ncbi:MAG: hypothetical protein H7231_06145 [Rhodoferax sp.]|nr:hypothetical protein [Actinomycetota bacterium]
MNRRERLLLLAFFVVVLVLLVRDEQTATLVGGVAGAGAAVVTAGRLHRLGRRMDERLGADPVAVKDWSWRRPALRAGAHLTVLGGLLLTTVFVPFVGDELFAGAAAAVTAFPAILTASRLRR